MADEKQTQEENASPYGYYVFDTTSGQPWCVLYATEVEAIAEAKRLAVKHSDARIVICEVVGTVEIEAEHKRVFKDGTVI